MSFFDFDTDVVAPQLMPPELRQPAHKAWLKVLLRPIQYLWQLIFEDYKQGTNYPLWDSVSGYAQFTRVTYSDNCNYECINPAGASGAGQSPTNTTYWRKIQDIFIGTDERIKYNSQIIILEYALNKWFHIPTSDPQVYIATNAAINSTSFVLANNSIYTSNLANISTFSTTYLTNAYIAPASQFNYDVNIPTAVFSALLPPTTQGKEDLIRQFIDKYNLAGLTYQIVIY